MNTIVAPIPLEPSQPVPPRTWNEWHTGGVLLVLAALVLPALLAQPWFAHQSLPGALASLLTSANGRLVFWLGAQILLLALLLITGHGVMGVWTGLLIDTRNRISLARVQAVTWTVLILGAFYAVMLWKLAAQVPADTLLTTAIPPELWQAMGISLASLAGSSIILNTKASQAPSEAQTRGTFESLIAQGTKAAHDGQVVTAGGRLAIQQGGQETVTHKGSLVVKTSTQQADWPDLFRGDETSNAAQFDLGKVQLFVLTLIVVLAYAAALGAMFTASKLPATLPPLAQSTIALLVLSHAGYLAIKGLPHT